MVPFAFIVLQAVKTRQESRDLSFAWPTSFPILDNIRQVFEARDYMLVVAFINSTVLTVASVTLMVVMGAMVAYVLQRRRAGGTPW